MLDAGDDAQLSACGIARRSAPVWPTSRPPGEKHKGIGTSSESDKDQVYREARSEIGDFRFDKSVATVFDDMVSRSVPFYGEMQRYRALRATVLRLWGAAFPMVGAENPEDVIRFNEAVDQATAESLSVFLAEMDKTRDLFLGMMGHDLRGPLSRIASCARLEQQSRSDESPTAAIMLRSVAQMKALLDDLVEYTRNRLGTGLTINPAPCSWKSSCVTC